MASFSSLMLSHHSCVVCLFSLADLLGYVQGISGTNQIKSSYCTCIIYKCRSVYCIHTIYVILYPWHLILSYASTNKNLDDLHSLSRNPMVYGFQKTFPQCIFRKLTYPPSIDPCMFTNFQGISDLAGNWLNPSPRREDPLKTNFQISAFKLWLNS
jgi:hypothetical protein